MRESTKQKKREKILQSAEELFIEQGIENTTMNDIANRASMGVATIFRYFPKKDQLIDLVAADKMNILLDFIKTVKQQDMSYLEKISTLMDFFINQMTENGGALPKIMDYTLNYIAVTDFSFDENQAFIQVRNELFKEFFILIENGTKDGSIRTDINANEIIPTIMNNFSVFSFKLSVQTKTNILEPELPAKHQLQTMKEVFLSYLTSK